MTSNDYFTGGSGRRYTYAEIANRIRNDAPHTLGKHIFVQLEAIGLLDEMQNGTTPCGLPFTFAGAPEAAAARKLLTALNDVLPYAEAERASLCEAWRRDRDRAVNVELHACDLALGQAADAIAEAVAAGIQPVADEPDEA
jgi:hypothetical protein